MISMVKILEVIQIINPNAKVAVRGTSLDDFVVEYFDETPVIEKQTIIDKYNELVGT